MTLLSDIFSNFVAFTEYPNFETEIQTLENFHLYVESWSFFCSSGYFWTNIWGHTNHTVLPPLPPPPLPVRKEERKENVKWMQVKNMCSSPLFPTLGSFSTFCTMGICHIKVHIFWEGQHFFRNLHFTFDCHNIGQK